MLRALALSIIRGRPILSAVCAVSALVFAVMLLVEGSRPATRLPLAPALPHFDKVLHFGAHFILTGLFFWTGVLLPRRLMRWRLARAPALAFALDVFLGIAVEGVQVFMGRAHGRRYELWDVAANTCGAFAAIITFLVVVKCALSAYIKGRRGQGQP